MESRNTDKGSIFRSVDWVVIILYLLLVAGGAISIYAASYDFDNASIFSFDEFSGKQIRWIGFSFVLGLVLLLVDKRMYETYAYPIYFAVLMLLAVTIVVAPNIKGSHSWLVLGPMSLQPAEFGKFATALALAKLFSGYNFNLNAKKSNYVKALAIIGVPILLILAQNETGSALVYLSLMFVLYREGMSGLVLFAFVFAIVIFVVTVKYTTSTVLGMLTGQFVVILLIDLAMVVIAAFFSKNFFTARNLAMWFAGVAVVVTGVAVIGGVELPGMPIMIGSTVVGMLYCVYEIFRSHCKRLIMPVIVAGASLMFMMSVNYVFNKALQPHQQTRIKVSLGIVDDPLKTGYNVNQAKIAIGSGGLTGKGFLNGTQTKLKYVPEQHTDFIFCTIGEEEGFVGSTITIVLFLALILRVIAIAERQPTPFGRVYSYCVASYLIFHLCINIGMVIGLCPVIGIPLPFFSYGGSSLWGFTVLIFIMLRIDASRREFRNY